MGGKGDVDVNLGGTTQINAANTIDIIGLDDIGLRTELVLPQPLTLQTDNKSQSRTELAFTEPIRSEGRNEIALDIRPLTVDLCLDVNFGRLPQTCIRQPYRNHFGITLFGVEILGFNLVGESQIFIEDLPKKPHVAWGGEQAAGQPPARRGASPQPEPGGGLRIRVGP